MENIDNLVRVYFIAKTYVIQKGFSDEIDWQEEEHYKLRCPIIFKRIFLGCFGFGFKRQLETSKLFQKLN